MVKSWHCLPNNFSTRFYTKANKSTQKTNLFRCGCGCEAGPRDFKNGVKKIGPLGKKFWIDSLYDVNGQSSCKSYFVWQHVKLLRNQLFLQVNIQTNSNSQFYDLITITQWYFKYISHTHIIIKLWIPSATLLVQLDFSSLRGAQNINSPLTHGTFLTINPSFWFAYQFWFFDGWPI